MNAQTKLKLPAPVAAAAETESAPQEAPTKRSEQYDEFNWSDDPNIIIHHQPRTKVYTNVNDQVVIRQERDWCENDDPFVYFSRDNVPVLIAELQRYVQEG